MLTEDESTFLRKLNELCTAVSTLCEMHKDDTCSAIQYNCDIIVYVKSIRLVWDRYVNERDEDKSIQFHWTIKSNLASIVQCVEMSIACSNGYDKYSNDIAYIQKKVHELVESFKLVSKPANGEGNQESQFCLF